MEVTITTEVRTKERRALVAWWRARGRDIGPGGTRWTNDDMALAKEWTKMAAIVIGEALHPHVDEKWEGHGPPVAPTTPLPSAQRESTTAHQFRTGLADEKRRKEGQ